MDAGVIKLLAGTAYFCKAGMGIGVSGASKIVGLKAPIFSNHQLPITKKTEFF